MGSWNELPLDILVQIFMCLNILDVLNGASRVCKVWREACLDPRMWETIDLTKAVVGTLDCVQVGPFGLTTKSSSTQLMRVLKDAVHLSRGAPSRMIFNFYVQTGAIDLMGTALRCTGVKKLVLPTLDFENTRGFYTALTSWKKLEFLTVPCAVDPVGLFKALGENCKNLTHLKLMFPLKFEFAKAICDHLPQLKGISVRYTVVYREAVVELLSGLKHLEVFNLSHILIVTPLVLNGRRLSHMGQEMDGDLIRRASHLKAFVTCQNRPCVRCKGPGNSSITHGGLHWFDSEEEVWRLDEVPCFEI